MLFAPTVTGQTAPNPLVQLIPLFLIIFLFLRKSNKPIEKQKNIHQAKKKTEYNDYDKGGSKSSNLTATDKNNSYDKMLLQVNSKKQTNDPNTKYDHFINCPVCKGTGIANIYSFGTGFSIIEKSETYSIAVKKIVSECKCPCCNGDGTAICWFEKNTVCNKCKGIGKINTRAKLDIGMGDMQIDCDQCNCSGKCIENELVHILFKSGYDMETDYEHERYDVIIQDGNRFPFRCVQVITDSNIELYAKRKIKQS